LSDGYLANGSEPWRLPAVDDLPEIEVKYATEFNMVDKDGNDVFWPFLRGEDGNRPIALPGTPDLMHRLGGIEKEDGSGNVSYDPDNHEYMVRLRNDRIASIPVPDAELEEGSDGDADLLVVGWGSTWGAITGAARRVRAAGGKVDHIQLTHLNPLPANLGDLLRSRRRVLVPELNLGQLVRILRAEYLVDARPLSKVKGQPFTAGEIHIAIGEVMEELSGSAGGSTNEEVA
jgi:2-oxoglutarate ferredoxin oxidoreductase subunit alpha